MPREQLEKQYCSNGVQSQPQISSFKSASVRSAIPDPDVPQSCANSSEYVGSYTPLHPNLSLWCLEFICSTLLIFSLLNCNLLRSAISLPGDKQKSASDDRDSALAGLLQAKSGGRLGPQWIRPTPPRLPILDGEVKYSIL